MKGPEDEAMATLCGAFQTFLFGLGCWFLEKEKIKCTCALMTPCHIVAVKKRMDGHQYLRLITVSISNCFIFFHSTGCSPNFPYAVKSVTYVSIIQLRALSAKQRLGLGCRRF